mgnify:CR=1 FL=1
MTDYKKGNIVTGCITGIEKYGAFVSLDEYYKGLIHISEISKNYVKNINDYVKIGDTIRAKVIDVDNDSFHVKLSIKDLNYDIDVNVTLDRKGLIFESIGDVHEKNK